MTVYTPTINQDFYKNDPYKRPQNYYVKVSELDLVKLELIPNRFNDTVDSMYLSRCLVEKKYFLQLDEVVYAHHFAGIKKKYLERYAYKLCDWDQIYFYVLPQSKVKDFVECNIYPKTKTIDISVCQNRIPKIGKEVVKYVAYNECNQEGEYCFVCRKKVYDNHCDHYGKHIIINVHRPEIMFGTYNDIEEDIKGIIFDELEDMGFIEKDGRLDEEKI